MIDIDTNDLIDRLRDKTDAINSAIAYIEAVRGAAHFRESVEQLLIGTAYEKPKGYDVEGLYGRVRAALRRETITERRVQS